MVTGGRRRGEGNALIRNPAVGCVPKDCWALQSVLEKHFVCLRPSAVHEGSFLGSRQGRTWEQNSFHSVDRAYGSVCGTQRDSSGGTTSFVCLEMRAGTYTGLYVTCPMSPRNCNMIGVNVNT